MSTANAIDREMRLRRPLRHCAWFSSRWFLLTLVGTLFLAILTGLVTGAPATYLLGQIVLGLSFYLSSSLLADRPLINPIQAVVGVFYWWFGVGPVVISTWSYAMGMSDVALTTQVSSMEALWIVAPGLLLYAFTARLTLQWFSRTGLYARFILPTADNYRPKVLIIYLSLMGFSMLALAVLNQLGIQGREETSFYGGMRTDIWWVGVIAAIGSIAPFVKSALMTILTKPLKTIPFAVKVLIAIVLTQTIMAALFGGWKSPLAFLGAYYVFSYTSRYQRLPWLFLAVGATVFLVIITPFVEYGRHTAIISSAKDSTTRNKIYSDVLKDSRAFLPTAMETVDPSIFFRDLSLLASELTRRNGLFNGEWDGDTIMWGFEILVPRVLIPDKRYANIGNFFAQTVGVDIGTCGAYDTLTNISISIPFEFVGNYGWFAGFLSFGLIGVFWSIFCAWMLSPARLSSHPLSPFFVLLVGTMEAPMGHFLAGLRELIIPLLLCLFVYKYLSGKI